MSGILGNKPYSLTLWSLERLGKVSRQRDFVKFVSSLTISNESFLPRLVMREEYGQQIDLAKVETDTRERKKRKVYCGRCDDRSYDRTRNVHLENIVADWPSGDEPESDLVPYKRFLAEKCKRDFKQCRDSLCQRKWSREFIRDRKQFMEEMLATKGGWGMRPVVVVDGGWPDDERGRGLAELG